MRFDEFVLRVPGEEFRIRFHAHLTVLAGVEVGERKALIDSIVGAMTGGAADTALTCRDHTGRPMELVSTGVGATVRFLDDGTPGPTPIGSFAPDADALRRLIVLGADDLGLAPGLEDRPEDTPEVSEARATLRELAGQLRDAEAAEQRLAQAKETLDDLDRRIRAAEDGVARREYARVLARLEKVRAEASVLEGGAGGAGADRRLLDGASEVEPVAARWRGAASAAAIARGGPGTEDINPVELGRFAGVPAAPPAHLGALLAQVAADEAQVAALERRIHDLASATLPVPEDPRILALATADQRLLWEVHRRLVWADEAVEREQVALGGLGAQEDEISGLDVLEEAHRRVEAAEEELERRRVPVLTVVIVLIAAAAYIGGGGLLTLPFVLAAAGLAAATLRPVLKAQAAAKQDEEAALAAMGVPSYLAFHLRRVDATLDPTRQTRLEVARAEAALARRSWESVAGSADPAAATLLEAEIKAYATDLRQRGGAVDELAQLHRALDEVAQRALRASQEQLVATIAPYRLRRKDVAGLNPAAVAALVSRRVALGFVARGQQAAVDAEEDEEKLAGQLHELLTGLQIENGPLDDRLAALASGVTQATQREAARAVARSRAEVQADLIALEAEVRRLERPEFATVRATGADEADLESLVAERDLLRAALARDESLVIDLDRIADRHAAMARRVTALLQANGSGDESLADLTEVHRHLLARLTQANRVGPSGEPVPMLLDDPFVRVPAERKWELMDLLRRLAERTQLLYLTDDPFVGAWARRRADADSILLLEPVD